MQDECSDREPIMLDTTNLLGVNHLVDASAKDEAMARADLG